MWLWEAEAAGCKWFRTFCKSLSSSKPQIPDWYGNHRQTHYPESQIALPTVGSFFLYLTWNVSLSFHTLIGSSHVLIMFTLIYSDDFNTNAFLICLGFGSFTGIQSSKNIFGKGFKIRPWAPDGGKRSVCALSPFICLSQHLFFSLLESCSFPSSFPNHLSIFTSISSLRRPTLTLWGSAIC